MTVRTVGIVGGGRWGRASPSPAPRPGSTCSCAETTRRARRGRASRRSATPWTGTSRSGGGRSRRRRRSWRGSASVDDFAALEAADIVIECVTEDLELEGLDLPEARPGVPAGRHPRHQHVDALGHRDRDAHPPPRPRHRPALPAPRAPGARWSRWCAGSTRPTRRFAHGARVRARCSARRGSRSSSTPATSTTRVILPFLNEAMHVVMEGVATAEAVDTSMKLGYGLPDRAAGPGRPHRARRGRCAGCSTCSTELGDLKYRPCPLLRKMIRAGHLGVKSGAGFFEYDENERRSRSPRGGSGA